jgi:hypothetical protein
MMPTIQDDPSRKKEKKVGYSIAGSLSLFIHLGLFLLIGGTVIVEQIIPKQTMTGEVQVAESMVESPVEDTPEEMPQEDAPQTTDVTEQSQSSSAEASPFDMNTITVDSPTSFNLPALGATSAMPGLPGAGGSGNGTGGPGVRKKVTFLGIESNAERVGFYLDFSGSMDGEKKKKLLQEMDKTLKDLPDGMEILIINWAGPAWNLDEQADEVMKNWKKNTALDWTLANPAKVRPPHYFSLNTSVRKRILDLLQKTVQAPGGTDWRSPFILAAKTEKAPDVVYLMTDGQLDNQGRMYTGIDEALNAAQSPDTVINVVAVSPNAASASSLRGLSSKHKGKYTELK